MTPAIEISPITTLRPCIIQPQCNTRPGHPEMDRRFLTSEEGPGSGLCACMGAARESTRTSLHWESSTRGAQAIEFIHVSSIKSWRVGSGAHRWPMPTLRTAVMMAISNLCRSAEAAPDCLTNWARARTWVHMPPACARFHVSPQMQPVIVIDLRIPLLAAPVQLSMNAWLISYTRFT